MSLLPAGPPGSQGAPVALSAELVAFALAFSTLIGMAAGYLPAKQAASKEPVEALRYE